jgi:uncharacterized protein
MTTGPETPPPFDPSQQPGQPPPGYGQSGPPMGYPTAQAPMRPEEERMWAIGAHLGGIFLGFIAPLVVWLVFKDRSAFLDRTGKESLNFQLTLLIGYLVSFVLMIVLVGFLLFFVVWLGGIVLMVLATIKVASFEDYRYPFTIRLVK